MQNTKYFKSTAAKILVFFLALTLVFTMIPLTGNGKAYAADKLTLKTPALVVTGQALVGSSYTAESVAKEKSYTLDELKKLDGVTNLLYSAKKSKEPFTKAYHMVSGVKISSLISNPASIKDTISVIATDGYKASFKEGAKYANDGKIEDKPGLSGGRYCYDGFSASKKTVVPAVIAWAYSDVEGSDGNPPTSKPKSAEDQANMRLYVGQYDDASGGPEDMNQPLFNGGTKAGVNKIQAGAALDDVVLTVGSEEFTRADVLLMNFAERDYKYSTQGGDKTDKVRGVPLSELLKDYDDNTKVSFESVDGFAVEASGMSVAELKAGNYMIGYEANGRAIFTTGKDDPSQVGFFTLYGDGAKPAKMLNKVIAGGFADSPYKHITNGGNPSQEGPYNIDSITGATLTVEGPGTKTSVPLAVRDLENKNAGLFRGTYTDIRGKEKTVRTYEGMDLYYLLHNMTSGENGIQLTDKAYKVLIKNRNRNTIAELTLEDIEKMHNDGDPALIAYGTAYEDGTDPRPFVFDGASGASSKLGNEDGCLKFVYDYEKYGGNENYKKFGNMAYIYVELQAQPGFKHDKAPYKNAQNSQYVLTLTGSELGREVNYTVEQLENLVKYDENGNVDESNGYGYRDEYSLANSSYWYINTYEGVKLWSLLLHSGLPESKKNDDKSIVSFTSTDNYGGFDKFTLKQVADPNSFGFYEKNALDNNDGTYVPNENLRKNNDPATGDKLKMGYPVLVSYGTNFFPYVISKDLEGYYSGLSNDGGPLRVISGKKDYNHANGSNQAKLLDKVIVGDNTNHYSTHAYHSNSDYTALKDNKLSVKVTTKKNGKTSTLSNKSYKVSDLEDLIYDGKMPTSELKDAKVKAFYEDKSGNSDLYEGVNMTYFLKKVVQLSGSQGKITFTSTSGKKLTLDLSTVLKTSKGYNAKTELDNLSPVLAYGKNGSPLVKNSSAAGYEGTIKLAEGTKWAQDYKVNNSGGPLAVVFPRKNAKAKSTMGYLEDVASISVSLDPDKYAHIKSPYSKLAKKTVAVSGKGTRLLKTKKFTVSKLEGKQTLAGTYTFTMKEKKKGKVTQQRYRGINLYEFLKSTDVGLKTNADKVIVKTRSGKKYTFTMSQIMKAYKNTKSGKKNLPVILAFGSSSASKKITDGKPLVKNKKSKGYKKAYKNTGGPIKLVVGQTKKSDVNGKKCAEDVVSIQVTASSNVSWNHSSSETFKTYLDNTLELRVEDNDGNVLYNQNVTVKELEGMKDIISQEEIYATETNTWEGLNVYQMLQKKIPEYVSKDNLIAINCYAKDNYSIDLLAKTGFDQLKNGVKDGTKRVPVLLAYAKDGYPLASGGKNDSGDKCGPGYDSVVDNKGGPLRLMVHNAQGACLMETAKMVVKVGSGKPGPVEEAAFTIKGSSGEKGLSIADLKAAGAVEATYTSKGETIKARGVYLKDLLAEYGAATKFSIDAGKYDGEGTYKDITLAQADKKSTWLHTKLKKTANGLQSTILKRLRTAR